MSGPIMRAACSDRPSVGCCSRQSGSAGAFAVSVACFLVALVAALRVGHRNLVHPSDGASVLERIIKGLMLVRRDRRLIGTFVITVIYNTFGWPFTSMVPVIGQDN